jgi:1-acyl-sn-glycerol-3-phosphate acyltransferase
VNSESPSLVLDPPRVWSLDLPCLDGALRRLSLRTLLSLSGGTVSVTGASRLAAAPEPSLFALSHHNAWEAILAPAALMAMRRGRAVRFFADWMFVDLPWTGWLLRQARPIPVYGKPARFALRDSHRRRERRRSAPVDLAVEALAAGEDVGIYPEGRRNPDPFVLLRGRRGLGLVALRSGAAVVPVGVDFAARDRLGRTPRAGRFALRVGEPVRFDAEHAAWRDCVKADERRALERQLVPRLVDRVLGDVATLSRKIHRRPPRSRPEGFAADASATVAVAAPAAVERPAPVEGCVTAARVSTPEGRREALAVLDEVYATEKGWLAAVDGEIAAEPAADSGRSWFLARVGHEAAGLVRVTYDPPLELPAEAKFEPAPGFDLESLKRAGRFAEIGRMTVRPRFRRRPAVVLSLMSAAIAEVATRGCTHLLTSVFEDDPHSPYGFHTRVLGFERIGSHLHGELLCASRRILLVLELDRAIARARGSRRLARVAAEIAAGARA